jgi:hypothetical protein
MDPPAVGDDLLLVSGVDGATGGYLLPPLRPAVVAAVARGEPVDRHELLELRARHRRTAVEHLGPVAEVDPSDLAEAGWGVVFARDADPAVRRALRPLLDHRRHQATSATGPARYREFAGADGYQPGETAADFLVRHQVAPGQPADPRRMPYYLLLVGDPEAIPFGFQYRLDIVYAVGRLDLETPEDYERYALGVVDSEQTATAGPPQVTFFATRHPDDRPTRLSADHLVAPLARAAARLGTWPVGHVAGEAATKARLGRLLGGEAAPGLLFLAGHGMGFAGGDPRQRSHQGALLCQDWPGPLAWRAPIPPELYFAGDDLAGDARLDGLVVVLHACFGAGTPRLDDFVGRALRLPAVLAPTAFVGRLPQRLLGRAGGALAVIGHVERAWGYSYLWPGVGEQTAVYESVVRVLLAGGRVGLAAEFINDRGAALAGDLDDEREAVVYGRVPDERKLSLLWAARNDARNTVVLGDPAVRLNRHHSPYLPAGAEGTIRRP